MCSFCLCIGGHTCGVCFVNICSPSVILISASGRLCYVIVAFSGYLHLHFWFGRGRKTNILRTAEGFETFSQNGGRVGYLPL